MRLFYVKRSPFARKVRLVAHEKGLNSKIALQEVDLANPPAELVQYNPLGKIPTLVLDDGSSLMDSPVICRFLDGMTGSPLLIPRETVERYQVLCLEALADGIMDAAIAAYQEQDRPKDKQMPEKTAKHRNVVVRTIHAFEEVSEFVGLDLNLAHLALASALGYVDFRLPDLDWRSKAPGITQWYESFKQRPSMQATIPSL